MRHIIISKSLEDTYDGDFTLVRRCKDIEVSEDLGYIIFHQPEESSFDVGLYIQKWYGLGIRKFIYIASEEHQDSNIIMLLGGINGHCYDDEFYLEDQDELEMLIEDIDSQIAESEKEGKPVTTELAVTTEENVNILRNFIHGFVRGEQFVKSDAFLSEAKNAITSLATVTEQQSLQIQTMGQTAMSVFETASNMISNIDKQKKDLIKKLEALQTIQANERNNTTVFGGGITFFPSYSYMSLSKVIVVRELTSCRYLTSFLIGYAHYLHYKHNKKVKLVIVHQRGDMFMKRYETPSDFFVHIIPESITINSLYEAQYITTNNPKSQMFKTLFSQNCDVFIILDRLYQDDPIVTGKTSLVNAATGLSDIEKYKNKGVTAKNTIFSSIKQDGELLHIPRIKGYGDSRGAIDKQLANYSQLNEIGHQFDNLNRFVGINTQ